MIEKWRALKNRYILPYINRVRQDGVDWFYSRTQQELFDKLPRKENIVVGWIAGAGVKKRTSTIYTFLTKLYSLIGTNDIVQTTESLQPFESGIAPISPKGIMNVNGGARYMIHPAVSFAADEAWTLTLLLKWNGTNNSVGGIMYGTNANNYSIFQISDATYKRIVVLLGNNYTFNFTLTSAKNYVGKTKAFTFVADGLNNLSLFIDGVFIQTVAGTSTQTQFYTFIIYGGNNYYYGIYLAHLIRNIALTPAEVLEEYNVLRSKFPEIPVTPIAGYEVAVSNFDAVATPQGNIIAEVQSAGNVEKITQPINFLSTWNAINSVIDSATGFNTIGLGNGGVRWLNALVVGKWNKLTYSATSSFDLRCYNSDSATNIISSTQGTVYFKAITDDLYFRTNGDDTITDFSASCEQVGWSGLTDLFTWLTTTGGYTEANALKEVAGWASHSNSLDYQAIFGKMFSGYAKKVIVTDIAATSGWGYHVSTEAELTALAALGGNALKAEGTNYWATTGGTNTTGLTLLGGGSRSETDGAFSTIKETVAIWCADSDKVLLLNHDDNTATIVAADPASGAYIRLIKD